MIIRKLNWANSLKELIIKFDLPKPFIEKICLEKKYILYSREQYQIFQENYLLEMEEIIEWYLDLFDKKMNLKSTELSNLILRIQSGVNNLASLEEWVDFKASRNKCVKAGLGEFISKIEKYQLPSNSIVDIFKKQFYRLWLDEVLPEYPAVNLFRRQNHETTTEDFVNLDLKQLKIAKSRIREYLISKIPDIDMFVSPSNEVGILKREISKQRKIMPIRKFFNAIPDLLMAIKPCLMMSPLSVSLFLESEQFQFDTVIFDEASQVCTEDSIGAIFRGKQVIVVGDSQQLPPTNFFSSSIYDKDFDLVDEEDDLDDIDAFESILDLAVTALPERTLRWHYRSRHEHLIAFSNAKIYNQRLITFPSFIENKPDIGVEYIFVSNGVYDRSGKRSNIIEA